MKITTGLTFDDVLIIPKFSKIKSRRDVDTSVNFLGQTYNLAIVSSNMDTVTSARMSQSMLHNGAAACIHRFCSIDENVKLFNDSVYDLGHVELKPWVSVGIGGNELERAQALYNAGAETFLIDVAHGATMEVVNQVNNLDELFGKSINIIVGNFATGDSINDFVSNLKNPKAVRAFKVGIGGGSACTTRIVTGCGVPTLSSVHDCASTGFPIIADGGCRNSGDICKALAAGASMVMLGGMLAGTDEAASLPTYKTETIDGIQTRDIICKSYRGSASAESYVVQNKIADWRSAEGESFLVPYVGSVKKVLQQIEGGLRSSMSYVGASTLEEFFMESQFIEVTNNSVLENKAHGKT